MGGVTIQCNNMLNVSILEEDPIQPTDAKGKLNTRL